MASPVTRRALYRVGLRTPPAGAITALSDARYLARVEAFESFVAVALEYENYVVSSGIKLPVPVRVNPTAGPTEQVHGFEVDLVGARANGLVLATVKSYFGSTGVVSAHVMGEPNAKPAARKLYRLLNDVDVREKVVAGAADRFGYAVSQVELRFYVGKFAGPTRGVHERRIRRWCSEQRVGAGEIKVIGVQQVVDAVLKAAAAKQYRDDPVLVAMKVLHAAGRISEPLPDDIGAGLVPDELAGAADADDLG